MGLARKAPVANGGRKGDGIPFLADSPIGLGQWSDDLFTAATAAFVGSCPVSFANVESPILQSLWNGVYECWCDG